MATGEPKGKMTAGGMTDDDHPGTIDAPFVGAIDNQTRCRSDIGERARPPSSALTNPPVVDIRHHTSGQANRLGDVAEVVERIFGFPEPAMNQDGARKWSVATGKAEIDELRRFHSVSDPSVRRCGRTLENLFARHPGVAAGDATGEPDGSDSLP